MGETAGEIRRDIEQTRLRMTATIEAIGYRLDLPARMRYRFSHIVKDVSGTFSGKADGGDGGEPGLFAAGEEMVDHMVQAAQTGVAGVVGAVEGRVSDLGRKVQSGVSGIKENIVGRTTTDDDLRTEARATTEQMREAAIGPWQRIGDFARDNALALTIGALAVGVLAGMFIPRSRIEQDRIGPLANEIKHRAVETGERVIQRGQRMAQESLAGQQRSDEPVHAGHPLGGAFGEEY